MEFFSGQEEPPESLFIIFITAEAAFNKLTELAEESEDKILELEDDALAEESGVPDEEELPLLSCHGLANSSLICCFESVIG